ncbi:MAG: tetratricopeptide repeat protein [Promethearchaeota archaeon]
MFKRFKPAEQVFVDREDYLDWMTKALQRCKDQSVILHLRGIGGIGKTALLNHWKRSIERAIFLDCSRVTDFYDRLDALAKGAVRLGIKLRRFDLLWSIRLRFVMGVEPAKEPGRSWAFDIIKPLPFIGSMVNIGKAIRAVGMKLSPRLKRRFGDVASWLRENLGKNYIEKLLEMLWKEPHLAEALYLDALLEDLSARKQKQPLLVLLDHFEQVDSEQRCWQYSGRKISEDELWYVFLSSLRNGVGVTASRRGLPARLGKELVVEEAELTELDEVSCCDLLTERGVTDPEFQARVVSVSGGNPFVLSTICDIAEIDTLSVEDLETLRADTLREVRLKTWRRLFSRAEGLDEIIDRAGLLPYFTQRTLTLLVPHLKTDHWARLTRLSFVRDRGDGTWDLHDLARELVLAELGDQLPTLVSEVVDRLERGFVKESDLTLWGMALSVQALTDEPSAIVKFRSRYPKLEEDGVSPLDPARLTLLESIRFTTDAGQGMLLSSKAVILGHVFRYAEAERAYREAIRLYRGLAAQNPSEYQVFLARALGDLAEMLIITYRFSETDEPFQEALQLLGELRQQGEKPLMGSPDIYLALSANYHCTYGTNLFVTWRIKEGIALIKEGVKLYREYVPMSPPHRSILALRLAYLGIFLALLGRASEAEERLREASGIIGERPKDALITWSFHAAQVRQFQAGFLGMTTPLSEGEMLCREAVELFKEYAEIQRPHHKRMHTVGWSLAQLGWYLRRLGRVAEAEEVFEEALDILRNFYEKEPLELPLYLAQTLNSVAILFRQTGRLVEAKAAYQEALTLSRQVVDQLPEVYTPRIIFPLSNYGVLLRQTGDLAQAEAQLQEAQEIFRSYVAREPDYFNQSLAVMLNNLGVVLAEAGNPTGAEQAFQEALKLRRALAEKAPSMYRNALSSTLHNLGVLFRWMDRLEEAEKVYREALVIRGELAAKAPEAFQPQVVKTLSNLALLLKAIQGAGKAVEEVVGQLRELGVTKLPDTETWSEEEVDYFL